MWESMLNMMNESVVSLGKAQRAAMLAMTRSMELSTNTYARMWGAAPKEVFDTDPHADRRFDDKAWQENITSDVMRQTYLITARWMEDVAEAMDVLDPHMHHQVKFFTKQIADAISPSNNPLLNPTVVQETVRTGGANLVNGMQHLMTDISNGRVAQVPENSFEVGKDLAITPGKVVYRSPLIEVMQYTPTTEKVHPIPVLMVPPWINKYYVMDMAPENSMYKYLVDKGMTVFTISWKNPDKSILDLEWDDYVDQGVLDALRVVQEITGAKKVNAVGYCLGGLVLQVTLAYLAALGKDDVINTATFFTVHQDFTDVGDVAVFIDEGQVQFLEWLMDSSGGYLDGKNMAFTFNMLRANDLFWRFVINNYMMGKEPHPFGLLYWNADGTRIPGKVHKYLIREFFLKDKLKDPDGLQVRGVGIDLGKITTPSYAVTAIKDHIVPWKGAYSIRRLMGGPVRFVLSEGGHIAGVISSPSKKRQRAHWINDEADTADPEEWLQGAEKTVKSWWTDWVPWMKRKSGRKTLPPSMGNETYPPIMDAPGTYVLEK